MKGTLFIVGTPIGNLRDITFRAVDTLREVQCIACEDTRVTGKLLHAYDIHTPSISLHEHTSSEKLQHIIQEIEAGKNIAYTCDAGTPGMNDPGGKLVQAAHEAGIRVIPIPGASALTSLISVCGFPMDDFIYAGFVPHKKGRKTFFEKISTIKEPVIFLESTHRIEKCLDELVAILEPTRLICIGRELTKMHETVYRGIARDVQKAIGATSSRGEFTLVVGPRPKG